MTGRPTAVLVWLVWAAGVVWHAGLIDRYAGKNPYFDDIAYFGLNLLPKNATPADLWIPINEHRVPVPKFTTWAVSRVGGYNLRNVMRVSLGILAAGTAAALWAAGRVRGGHRLRDAAIPLVLLSPGLAEKVIWAVEVNFLLPVGAELAALALVVTCGPRLSGRAVVLGGLATLMAGSGFQGQIPAAALGLWLIAGGLTRAAVAGGLLALAVVGVCLAAYQRPAAGQPLELGLPAVRYVLRVVASAWGPAVEAAGPAEHPLPTALGLVTLALVGVAGWAAVRALRRPDTRVAAGGGLAVLLGGLGVCVAIGVARGPANQWRLADRYVVLACPTLAAAYLLAGRFAPSRAAAVVQSAVCVGAVAGLWPNAAAGLRVAEDRRLHHRLVEEDARRGVPASFFPDHHGGYLFPPAPAETAVVFDALRNMHVFPYHVIPPEPTLRETPAVWQLAAAPPAVDGWGRVAAGDRWRATLTLSLPAGTKAVAIETSVRGSPAVVRSELWWDDPAPAGAVRRTVLGLFEPGDGRRKRVWLGRPVGRLDLAVEGPAEVRIDGVTALVAD